MYKFKINFYNWEILARISVWYRNFSLLWCIISWKSKTSSKFLYNLWKRSSLLKTSDDSWIVHSISSSNLRSHQSVQRFSSYWANFSKLWSGSKFCYNIMDNWINTATPVSHSLSLHNFSSANKGFFYDSLRSSLQVFSNSETRIKIEAFESFFKFVKVFFFRLLPYHTYAKLAVLVLFCWIYVFFQKWPSKLSFKALQLTRSFIFFW